MKRKIGLEFEFIALRKNGQHITRRDVVALWKHLQGLGWMPKIDAYTKKIVGVYGKTEFGALVLDNDGGSPLLEIGWPPYPDLFMARKKMRETLSPILTYFKDTYRLVGYGCAPFSNPRDIELTPKAHYPVIIKTAKTNTWRVWRRFYMVGALQVNLGGRLEELVQAQNVFLRLTGIMTALSANTSIIEGKIQKYKEMRQFFYDDLRDNFPKVYTNQFGIPNKPHASWQEYFFTILKRPARLLALGGKLYEVKDRRAVYDIIMQGDTIRVKELMHRRIEYKVLTPKDLTLLVNFFWPDARLKFQFKSTATMPDFVRALQSTSQKFENYLKDTLENYYLEIRPCAMQQPEDLLAMPAFMLGIVENLSQAERILKQQTWQFWRDMRTAAYRHGMQASVKGTSVTTFLLPLYRIAEQGLKKRKRGEEKFLRPLKHRILSGKTPADVAEDIYKKKGKKTFLYFLTFHEAHLLDS